MKKNPTRPNYLLFAILLAGFLLRLFLFWHFQAQPNFFYDDDSRGYVQLAENLRQGHGFSWDTAEPYISNSFRTPGYPVFLLGHRLILGRYQTALITQIFLMTAVAYLIYLLAGELRRPRLGLTAAGLFLFMPFSVMVSLRYLTQPLFTFLLMLTVWCWIKFLKNRNNRYFFGAIMLLPLLALVRPVALYLPSVFILSLLLSFWSNKKQAIKKSAILIMIFFAVLFSWLWRNHTLFGQFALSSLPSYQLYFYDTPAVYARNHDLSYAQARQFLESDIKKYLQVRSFDDYMTFGAAQILFSRARHYLSESWTEFVIARLILFFKFFARDGLHYWAEFGLSNWLVKFGALAERGILLLLGLGLAWSAWQSVKRNNLILGFLIALIVYFAFLTGAVASAGLRFPVEPLIILTGLLGWQDFFEKTPALS